MPETAQPARRTFIGAMGWCMGAVGVGAIGYTLIQSTQAPPEADPRVHVALPDKPDDYFKIVSVLDRPVGVRGLTAAEAATLDLMPMAPRFLVIDLVCTLPGQACVVAPQKSDTADPSGWTCP